jgi:hypothetical protein
MSESIWIRLRKRARLWLVVPAAWLCLGSAAIVLGGVDGAEFGASAGLTWAKLGSSAPLVQSYLNRLFGLLGVAGVGLMLRAMAVILGPFRRGEPWSWVSVWILPATLAGWAGVFLIHSAQTLGLSYLALAAATVFGLLLDPALRLRRA